MKTTTVTLLSLVGFAKYTPISSASPRIGKSIPSKESLPEFVTLVNSATNPFEVQLKGELHGRTFVLSVKSQYKLISSLAGLGQRLYKRSEYLRYL